MISCKFPTPLVLFSLAILAVGCNGLNGEATPTNPFASNLRTVPQPATFSNQELILGQVPGTFIPQMPATTFPTSGSVPSAQPETPPPSNVSLSDSGNNIEGATLFMAAQSESGWTAAEVTLTNQTAFGAMDASSNPTSSFGSGVMNASESLVVGTSHIVTTVTDGTQSVASLNEQQSLFSGGYTE